MSFVRVNPSGWAVGAKLTSAQQNQIDINISDALDKSTAGDTLNGTITFSATGLIEANQASCIEATVPNAVVSEAAYGITSSTAYGIASQGVNGIATATASGIQSNIAGGITTSVAGGIASGTAGGIKLTGGTSDWIVLGSTRNTSWATMCVAMTPVLPSGWSLNSNLLLGTAASAAVTMFPQKLMDGSLNGAKLSEIKVVMQVGSSHSGVPQFPPTLNLQRYSYQAGTANPVILSLFSTGAQPFWPTSGLGGIPTPASGAAWYQSQGIWQIAFTPDQNNTIDLTQYSYDIVLVDEQGTNSLGGNTYIAMILTFSNIGNDAPG